MDRRPPPPLRDRDLEVLRFAADQRLFLGAHVRSLLGCSSGMALASLRRLVGHGLVERHRVFHGEPSAYTASRAGLRMVGSSLAPAQLDLSAYAHDIGVVWAELAARRGTIGPMAAVISERRMRSEDSVLHADPLRDRGRRLAVRLGGVGPAGRARLHYPDLMLVTPEGRMIAVEVELSAKGRRRRDGILLGYAGANHIDAVLYLVERPAVARAVEASARRNGIEGLVHVQRFRWVGRVPGTAGRSSSLAPQRAMTGGRASSRASERAVTSAPARS